jgi:putative hydrolase of the HAD superfamily
MGVSPPALLCDYGGVLTTSLLGAAEQVCRDHGIEHDGFRAALRALRELDDPVARLETGEIDGEMFKSQFGPQLSEALGGRLDGIEFLRLLEPLILPEQRMLDALDVLRAHGVPTALVSNSWSDNYPAEALKRFDAVLLSGRLGLRKPDPEIYLQAAAELRVAPQDCVFLDDFPVNITTAQELGMRAILHTTVELTLPQLADAFGVDLPA